MTSDNANESKVLHVGEPNFGSVDLLQQHVASIFRSRRFTNNGPLVQQLEAQLAEYLEVPHCIAVCNATVGLQIACQALELTGEVIVPAFTFVATPHAVTWSGLQPVFADIDPQTHNISPADVESRITDRTSAIIGVHVWGRPCDTDALSELGDRHNLPVMYDSAHAFGCRHQQQMIGRFGQCEVFSFHGTKFFNTFEGGAITTCDDELAETMRRMRNFGFTSSQGVAHLGTNGKMTEICAAMGLAGMASLDEFLKVNHRNYETYRQELDSVPGVEFVDYDPQAAGNRQYIVVEVDDTQAGVTRDQVHEALHAQQILARRYFYPGCHRMEPYCRLNPDAVSSCPSTDTLCDRVLCLPTGQAISEADARRVCDVIGSTRL